MMDRPIRILFVEDEPQDSERYKHLISENAKITVTSKLAPRHVDEFKECLTPRSDLVLIDYRLTKRQPSGISATYRGGTLATYIAEQLPEIPLVIFSTRDVLNLYPNYEEEIKAADYILYKEDVNQNPSGCRDFLLALVQGFNALASVESNSRTWSIMIQLLKANSSEEEELQTATPPRGGNGENWSVHDVARWILRVLFRYPGVLYDSLYSSAALGIKEEDFLLEEVQSFFQDTRYTGVFAGIKKLWWRDRLQELAFRCIREAKLDPILSDNFMIAFEKKTGKKLEPSICIFSGEKNANTICYVLKKPVKMKYTLGYLPDDRPESMEPARISFKAVLEENINEKLLPRADAERLVAIRRSHRC